MTTRKPKPRKAAPRKASGPTLALLDEHFDTLALRVGSCEFQGRRRDDVLAALARRIAILETRSRYRDVSHDEPVSNASEAIGHFTLTEPHRPWWRRFLGFMGAP